MPPRYARKIDASQPSIVNGLREKGCSVEHLARMGEGWPDLMVGYEKVNLLFELKTPNSEHSKRKPGGKSNGSKTATRQLQWHESWRGTVYEVMDFEEAWGIVQLCAARWAMGIRDA